MDAVAPDGGRCSRRWIEVSGRRQADAANSGTAGAGLVSPKGTLTLGPWDGTELYVNAGLGFHSNDARGTTIVVDT